jgi:tRNA-modifying protein YgfZ
MTQAAFDVCCLPERGVVAIEGVDAVTFLDNLATNALDAIAVGDARFAGLLTPQGKILFEFFAVRTSDGFLLDVSRDAAPALCKRLTLYKLRAKIAIVDRSEDLRVLVSPQAFEASLGNGFRDPRDPELGFRLVSSDPSVGARCDAEALGRYHQHRIGLGIPDGGLDYPLGDTFPHEANYDLLNGVSFSKGCYVGQEVVSRMQNKTVVRKRIVKVAGAQALLAGSAILVGSAEIGRLGTVTGNHGLAMLRLDRVAEALAKGDPLAAGGVTLTADPIALARYAKSVADKPVIDL